MSDDELTAYRTLFFCSAAAVLLAAVLVTLLVPPAPCGQRTASSQGRTGWAYVLGKSAAPGEPGGVAPRRRWLYTVRSGRASLSPFWGQSLGTRS
ncbi:MAG: hypothetical protein ACK42I_00595 [Thermomicrobium sp.]